ncbi:MAG: hypothetical protein JSW27_00555 [Phycisphaerales bacterium]|nr:MAG: hypothetical protein JSW27_00555 [Phycisphaerales bacterium]
MHAAEESKLVCKTHLMIQVTAIALCACCGLAGAMQEYEDLSVAIEAFASEIEASAVQDDSIEGLCTMLRATELNDLSRILALVDELERRVVRALATIASEKLAGGNKAAGTRVRKQMQKVKQAAQLVRNRVIEIQAAP